MKKKVDIVSMGKHLAFLLRHDKEAFDNGLIDNHGWRKVSELKNKGYSKELLDEIVVTNNKQRYEYNDDETKIRARQGHSIDVDVELKLSTPPDILYHGTATRFLESINREGLNSGTRKYVHLSKDIETAKLVGARHGIPCIIEIDSKKMFEDGNNFFLSANGVWMTETVPQKYFKDIIYV